MTDVKAHNKRKALSSTRPLLIIYLVVFLIAVYLAIVPDEKPRDFTTGGEKKGINGNLQGHDDMDANANPKFTGKGNGVGQKLRRSRVYQTVAQSISRRRKELRKALGSLRKTNTHMLPLRLVTARENNEIVGERLSEIRAGTETVEEILHAAPKNFPIDEYSNKQSLELKEIQTYLNDWIYTLHKTLEHAKHGAHEQIWQTYHDLTVNSLYPWDREYLTRMPRRRDDDSIFISIASYRDENCPNTLKWAYEKAKYPEKLFIGLVQQNCYKDCTSGDMIDGNTHDVEPDPNCLRLFCETETGKKYCENLQIRQINIDGSEYLGPYAARYFASKLWYGEQWYMQIDAHMTFAQDWDAYSVVMLQDAPSKKPVISHYPVSDLEDLEAMQNKPTTRLCDPIFAPGNASQIISLEGSKVYDKKFSEVPRFAPFTAAGYFIAHSGLLSEIPFDPFLPWMFMGEDIIMSTRLWTAGYDIFSPSYAVVGHTNMRENRQTFWKSVGRTFSKGVYDPLLVMILDRIKYQLGYPEAGSDMLEHKTLLTAVEQYSMGKERPLNTYLRMVGLNITTKEVRQTFWCENGQTPPGMEQYAHYYEQDY